MPEIAGIKLTEKQALFYESYYTIGSETYGKALESARKANYSGNDNTLSQRAHELVSSSKAVAIKEYIQAESRAEVGITRQGQLDKLEQARLNAIKQRSSSAETSAIIAQNRMFGWDKDAGMGSTDQPNDITAQEAEELRPVVQALTKLRLKQG